MKKIKLIIKLFAFILIIKASFLVSFAFIGDDLGLDLYKNIDSGTQDLNNQMYSYELKGASPDGSIAKKINDKLKAQGLEDCSVSESISEDDVYKIAYGEKNKAETSGDTGLLSEKIEKEGGCIKTEQLNKTQEIIRQISIDSQKSAKIKSDAIYNISKTGLFSDGNIKNSPFDIVADIKDIDYIIFTQEIEYEGEENIGDSDLSDFLKGPLDKFKDKLNGGNSDGGEDNNDDDNKNRDNKNDGNNKENTNSGTTTNSGNTINPGDKTNYTCPVDESGLSEDDLNKILKKGNNNYSSSGGYRSGPINKNYSGLKPLSDSPFSFSVSGTPSLGGSYNSGIGTKEFVPVNDNEFFGGCKTFFCIEIEFLTHKGNLLIGGKTRSIESIMERSNNHLKKFANSSLIQSKMTTNNFELGLRDLNLSDIFSMPIVIIKKTPPILNLDFFNKKAKKEKKSNPNPFSYENLLKARFESVGIDYERENDLSKYTNRDSEIKNVINNAEMDISKIKENQEKRREKINELAKLNDHITRIVQSSYQEKETDGLYKEFVELEMFSKEIQNYIESFDKIAKKMLAIPIHP